MKNININIIAPTNEYSNNIHDSNEFNRILEEIKMKQSSQERFINDNSTNKDKITTLKNKENMNKKKNEKKITKLNKNKEKNRKEVNEVTVFPHVTSLILEAEHKKSVSNKSKISKNEIIKESTRTTDNNEKIYKKSKKYSTESFEEIKISNTYESTKYKENNLSERKRINKNGLEININNYKEYNYNTLPNIDNSIKKNTQSNKNEREQKGNNISKEDDIDDMDDYDDYDVYGNESKIRESIGYVNIDEDYIYSEENISEKSKMKSNEKKRNGLEIEIVRDKKYITDESNNYKNNMKSSKKDSTNRKSNVKNNNYKTDIYKQKEYIKKAPYVLSIESLSEENDLMEKNNKPKTKKIENKNTEKNNHNHKEIINYDKNIKNSNNTYSQKEEYKSNSCITDEKYYIKNDQKYIDLSSNTSPYVKKKNSYINFKNEYLKSEETSINYDSPFKNNLFVSYENFKENNKNEFYYIVNQEKNKEELLNILNTKNTIKLRKILSFMREITTGFIGINLIYLIISILLRNNNIYIVQIFTLICTIFALLDANYHGYLLNGLINLAIAILFLLSTLKTITGFENLKTDNNLRNITISNVAFLFFFSIFSFVNAILIYRLHFLEKKCINNVIGKIEDSIKESNDDDNDSPIIIK